eukprot:tig00020556_g11028.t1
MSFAAGTPAHPVAGVRCPAWQGFGSQNTSPTARPNRPVSRVGGFGGLGVLARPFFAGSESKRRLFSSSSWHSRLRGRFAAERAFTVGLPHAPAVQAVLSPALVEIFMCLGTNVLLSWLFHKISTTRPQQVGTASGLFASPLQTLIIGGCFLKAVSGIHPINLERMLSRRLFQLKDRHVAQAILFGYLLVQLASLRDVIRRAPARPLIHIDGETPSPSAEDDMLSPAPETPTPSPPPTPLDDESPLPAAPAPAVSPAALAEQFPRVAKHPAGALIMAARSWREVWWTVLAACVVAPVFEEWVYRGIVFRRLVVLSSPVFAGLATALIFGVSHCLFPFFAARDVTRRAPGIRKEMARQKQSARIRLNVLRCAAGGDWSSATDTVVDAWTETAGRPGSSWPFQALSKAEVKQLQVCEYPEDVEDLAECEAVIGRLLFRWYEEGGGKPSEAPLHAILGTRRAERREVEEWEGALEELEGQIEAQRRAAALPTLASDSLALAPMGAALSAAYVAAGGRLRASIACHSLLNALACLAALVLSGKLVFAGHTRRR